MSTRTTTFPGTKTMPGRPEPRDSVNPSHPPEGFPATDQERARDTNRNLLIPRRKK